MKSLTRLSADLPVGELRLSDFQVSASTLARVVADQFERRPDLPGVMVMEGSHLLGAISRRRFHEHMSHPYSQELFLKRPMQAFLDANQGNLRTLKLPSTEKVELAVQMALRRSAADLYEPIVVEFADDGLPNFEAYFLLGFQTLLLAQSRILESVNQEIWQQQKQIQTYLNDLEAERRKVTDYAQLLESKQTVIQDRNQQLEQQQQELLQRSQEISQLNQRFLQVGQLFSVEGKKAFQATFSGSAAICDRMNRVVGIGQQLHEELRAIRTTAHTISQLSERVRHLANRASLVFAQTGNELGGFSHIAAEIRDLVEQTAAANQQTERVTMSFSDRVEDLVAAARSGKEDARSLTGNIQQAEEALAELEAMVKLETAVMGDTSFSTEGSFVELEGESKELIHKIQLAETTLSELKELVGYRDSAPLIRKIQRALGHQKHYLDPRQSF